MESFIDEIRAVIEKYKAIASARVTALKGSIQVAWANFIKKPAAKNAPKPKTSKKVKKNG